MEDFFFKYINRIPTILLNIINSLLPPTQAYIARTESSYLIAIIFPHRVKLFFYFYNFN